MGTATSMTRRPRRSSRPRAGWLRGFSGLLAGGLAALMVALFVMWFVAARSGSAGPGAPTLAWHTAGAIVAVAGQVYADRRAGIRGTLAALGVIAVSAGVLAAEWLF
jgi:hypothetical protein